MRDINFDRIAFAVLRAADKGQQALVFVNREGGVSVTKSAVSSTYDMLTGAHPEGWRKSIGVYGEGVTRGMVDDDLEFMGYRHA